MAMTVFAGATRSGFFEAVARVMSSGVAKWVQAGVTGLTIADVLNLDVLHRDAIRIAPGASAEAINQVATTAARMLGLGPDKVLWPHHRRGPNQGKPITPAYFTLNLQNGQAWFSTTYITRKSAKYVGRSTRSRGYSRGARSGGTTQFVNKA